MTRYDHVGSTPSGSSLSTETDDPSHTSASDASGGDAAPGVRKHFVLDTNVLLHNPNAIFLFQEHEVVIPLTVIEELDNFKKNNDDTGRNARQVIRQIDRCAPGSPRCTAATSRLEVRRAPACGGCPAEVDGRPPPRR